MKVDYSKGKIYKVTNDYNDDVYINYTCDTLAKRFSSLKKNAQCELFKNSALYKLMNELGTDLFRIDLIEDYACNDKQALRQREGYWIRQIGTLNKVIAGRTCKEYIDDYKEKIKENKKIYYEQNKEHKKEYDKERRGQLHDKIMKKLIVHVVDVIQKST